jgi:hypothetical protein
VPRHSLAGVLACTAYSCDAMRRAGSVIMVWAISLFPRGSDQVIPQVLAVFLFYLPLVFPVGTTREGLLFGR